MGCGIACFGRRGQKTLKIENFGSKLVPKDLDSRGDANGTFRGATIGPRGAATWDLEAIENAPILCLNSSMYIVREC